MTPFYSKNGGSIKLHLTKIEEFLSESEYYLYVVSPESTIYVKVENNVVSEVKGDEIYRFIMDQAKECDLENEDDRDDLVDKVSTNRGRILSNLSSVLKPIELNFIEDTQDTSYIFYKNLLVSIKQDSIETKEYNEISGHVWKSQIKDRAYNGDLRPETFNELENTFYQFLCAINPGSDLDSLMSILGYMLHRYKRRDFAKAVILYDANIDKPDPCGGTGKSLLAQSLGHIRKQTEESGKANDPSKPFAFSRMTYDTDIFLIDDASWNYSFENIFPLITRDFVVERKNQNRFAIPFAKTPKLVITSNYCVTKEGDSYTRRVIEFVLDDTFNLEYKPDIVYKQVFFTDWDENQWHEFDNTMILALQFYLKNGVIEQVDGRKYYQLQNQTTGAFMEYAESFETLVKYYKKEKLIEFLEKYPKHIKIEGNTFTRWMVLYAHYKKWGIQINHSGGINYMQFYEGEKPQDDTKE